MREVILILHNIRSLHNVGSIFRTADAAGVQKIYLTGYTPAPVDALDRPREQFSKVSLGAEKTVAWEKISSFSRCVSKLRKGNFFIAALEQNPSAISCDKFRPPKRLALAAGNEVRGLSRSILKSADAVVEIPMRGKKESLNVSVAVGIALFKILR